MPMHISYPPLRNTLKGRGMRKEDLRISAGLTANMIGNMGKGKHISMETPLRICRALNCDIVDVLALEQDGNFAKGIERKKCNMMDSLDNTFILGRMFGHDIDVFDNAILSEVNFGFGSNVPVSPHPQSMRLSFEFQTFCKVLNPPKRWKRDIWDSVYIYITANPIRIEMNLREADLEENPLKVLSHRTEFLYRADITPDYSMPYYCTEFIFEKNHQIKFVHSIGHIQHISNHKEYIQ